MNNMGSSWYLATLGILVMAANEPLNTADSAAAKAPRSTSADMGGGDAGNASGEEERWRRW
jgi:hypothetical protein